MLSTDKEERKLNSVEVSLLTAPPSSSTSINRGSSSSSVGFATGIYRPPLNTDLLVSRSNPNSSSNIVPVVVATTVPSALSAHHSRFQTSSTPAASATANHIIDSDKQGDRIVTETESLYTAYKQQLTGPPHPSPLITTSTLQYATPVIDEEVLHPEIQQNDSLSGSQRDAIALARVAHLKSKALLIGDGTGVGKGREGAGCMLNHWKWSRDSKKHIIITVSAQLINDFERDLKAIGWPLRGKDRMPLFSINDHDADKKITTPSGILFCTYATLRQKRSQSSCSRIDQIVEWTGSGFSGILFFDEIHSAKDFPKTETSKAVVELQQRLYKSNVVYASATAMSSVGHLGSMIRLGLWDTDSVVHQSHVAYPDFKSFEKKWKSQTRSGLEVVSSELASQGLYIARRLSFDGTTFQTSTANLSIDQIQLHRDLCIWWTHLSLVPVLTDMHGRAQFWGAHLRFFKALLIAFRVDHCVELAKSALSANGAVVVSLIGTGEAAAKKTIDEKGVESLDDGFTALHECMRNIIKLAESSCVNGALIPAEIGLLKSRIDKFDLPPSPLDLLISKLEMLGYGDVVEMTGRNGGFYRSAQTGVWCYKRRTVSNVDGCRRFQSGKARIAIISAAASTGYARTHARTQSVYLNTSFY